MDRQQIVAQQLWIERRARPQLELRQLLGAHLLHSFDVDVGNDGLRSFRNRKVDDHRSGARIGRHRRRGHRRFGKSAESVVRLDGVAIGAELLSRRRCRTPKERTEKLFDAAVCRRLNDVAEFFVGDLPIAAERHGGEAEMLPRVDMERRRERVCRWIEMLFSVDGGVEEAARLIRLHDVVGRRIDHVFSERLVF